MKYGRPHGASRISCPFMYRLRGPHHCAKILIEVMSVQNICFNCFHYAPEGQACPYCRYDPSKDKGKYHVALKPGTILVNRYLIGRVLGQGGFGITYVALDNQTKSRVAIKEYMPSEFAYREEGTTELKLNNSLVQADFDYGKEQFLQEAKTLAEFVGNEHIIGIRDMFEANGTAYFAMEFAEGVSLKQYMEQRGGPLQVYEANLILLPIMEALQWVHSKGIIHRDIAPDNIMIRSDGKAKLIDFGAARYSTGEKSKSLDVILKHGFAPYEQYSRRGRQGPFTDVYAMAATYYYTITGKVPPDAVDRMDEDTLTLPSELGVRVRKETEAVLLKALAVSSRNRYQTMAEFYTALLNSMPRPFDPDTETEEKPMPARRPIAQEKPVQPVRDSAPQSLKEEPKPAPQPQKKSEPVAGKPKKKAPIIAIAAILAVCILAGVLFGTGIFGKKETKSADGDFKTVGSIVTFGSYEQDNDTSNGNEPIEWIVLDVQNGRSLLISKYALDYQPYNIVEKDVTWETCSLRKWLNDTFLTAAFTAKEKACIPTITVSADENPKYETTPGNSTKDQVFLISSPEAENRFDSNTDRKCKPTAYAIAQGSSEDAYGNCSWWLRSPGSTSDRVACVLSNGTVDNYGYDIVISNYYGFFIGYASNAVRPAIWVDTQKASSVDQVRSQVQQSTGDFKTVGSTVTFGSYEQDNDTSNGKEPIEWIVLDVQEGKSLLISKYELDCQPYNTKDGDVTWETCSLRTWLNDTFLKEAFSADEQEKIPEVKVTADENPRYKTDPGKDTQDRVFLLNIPEAQKYFGSKDARQCKPTAYAIKQGSYVDSKGNCWWWLRSPGLYTYYAAYVDYDGYALELGGYVCDDYAVRPALWVNLD